jgi:hypothetical protein
MIIGDYTTLHILGVTIIQQRGIPINQPGLNVRFTGTAPAGVIPAPDHCMHKTYTYIYILR